MSPLAGLGQLWGYIGLIAAYCAATALVMKLASYGGWRWRVTA